MKVPNLNKIIKSATNFRQTEKIDDVFRYMKKQKSLCLLYQEQKFIKIVTIEDVIEKNR